MSYQVQEETIEQIWRDLGQQVEKPRVAAVAHEVAAGLADARITGYIPLFVRRLVCERLTPEARLAAAPRVQA